MNHTEFEQEMHDYIHESYKEFMEYQNIVNDILDEFHRVCKSNDIEYFVGFGSLLGLIRDNGNIPWDYDIDVIVPIELREKLIKTLETSLGKEYYYVYKNNIKHYPTSCLRVCKKGYSYMALHVDVFFIMGCPDQKHDKDRFIKRVNWAYRARQTHNARFHLETTSKSKLKRIISSIYSYVLYPISENLLSKLEDYLYFKYPLNDSKKCIIFYLWNRTYSTSCFKSSKNIQIGNRLLSIPIDADTFLTEQYGDYQSYLPISNRFEEFYKMCKIVESREQYYQRNLRHNVE